MSENTPHSPEDHKRVGGVSFSNDCVECWREVLKPINGSPPPMVEKWEAASQLRWFDRFRHEISAMPHKQWARFYCSSTEHRGLCCESCLEDAEYEGFLIFDDHCCCLGYRASDSGRPRMECQGCGGEVEPGGPSSLLCVTCCAHPGRPSTPTNKEKDHG